MNKRGDLTTILILIAIMLGLAFASIIFATVFNSLTEEMKDIPGIPNNTISTIQTAQTSAPKLLDFLVFFTFVAFFIGLIISSIYIDVNPAVLIVFIVFLIIAVLLSGQVSNAYNQFVHDDALSVTAEGFPLTNMLIGGKYFPIIILVVGAIVVVILYGKTRRQGIGGEV